ncbi:MAG: aldehyde dehydrogenase family protein, partial [Deltaproteobacteria bacterium]|nr:aldehyde dehydrogenase family protein [Deltaproteobacteria bacterium]
MGGTVSHDVIGHFINGGAISGSGKRFGNVYNPATGEVAARVAFAGKEEVEKAVSAAAAAFPGWSSTPPLRRARI